MVIVLGGFGEEPNVNQADLWCEYETYWIEHGKVIFKMYDIHGPILVRMRIPVLMEGLLGEADFLERLTAASKG